MKKDIPSDNSSLGAQIMMASELGSSIVLLSVAGYFAGNFLDSQLKCSPFGVLLGIILGFSLGIAYVIKRSNQISSSVAGPKPHDSYFKEFEDDRDDSSH